MQSPPTIGGHNQPGAALPPQSLPGPPPHLSVHLRNICNISGGPPTASLAPASTHSDDSLLLLLLPQPILTPKSPLLPLFLTPLPHFYNNMSLGKQVPRVSRVWRRDSASGRWNPCPPIIASRDRFLQHWFISHLHLGVTMAIHQRNRPRRESSWLGRGKRQNANICGDEDPPPDDRRARILWC